MSNDIKISIEEVLELVTFTRNSKGLLRVLSVYGDVRGTVRGNVGTVRGDVGDVEGDVGYVLGDVGYVGGDVGDVEGKSDADL